MFFQAALTPEVFGHRKIQAFMQGGFAFHCLPFVAEVTEDSDATGQRQQPEISPVAGSIRMPAGRGGEQE